MPLSNDDERGSFRPYFPREAVANLGVVRGPGSTMS